MLRSQQQRACRACINRESLEQVSGGLISAESRGRKEPVGSTKAKVLVADLVRCVREWDYAGVMHAAANNGLSVNGDDGLGQTPLWWAVLGEKCPSKTTKSARLDIIRWLISAGANIHQANGEKRWNVLHLAASRGDLEVCKLLVERGIKPRLRTGDTDETSLQIATAYRRTAVARYLREVGNGCEHISTAATHHDCGLTFLTTSSTHMYCRPVRAAIRVLRLRSRPTRTPMAKTLPNMRRGSQALPSRTWSATRRERREQ